MKTFARLVASMLSVSFLLVAVNAPAFAGHGEQANSGDPDDGNHYVDRNNLTTNGNIAAERGVAQLDRAEDMTATFTGSGDVEIYDWTYGDTGWAGQTDCPDGVNWVTGNCDVFRVMLNQDAMAGLSADYWRSLGCHELGHTGGLGHRFGSTDSDNNSCMRSDIWPLSFDRHDLDGINSAV